MSWVKDENMQRDTFNSNGVLSRTQTLEAGGSQDWSAPIGNSMNPESNSERMIIWLASLIAGTDDPDDNAELMMRSLVVKLPVQETRSLEELVRNYTQFKHCPGYAVSFDLVQTWTFRDGTVDRNVKSKVDAFCSGPEASFSDVNTALLDHLSKHYPGSLRVIALGYRSDPSYDKNISTARHKLLTTLSGRLESLSVTPGKVIRLLVAVSLGIPEAWQSSHSTSMVRDTKRKLLDPSSNNIVRPTLDPTQLENNRIILKWRLNAPHFTSDIDVWMREPYRRLPSLHTAELLVWLNRNADNSTVMVNFSHCIPLKAFARRRTAISQNQTSVSTIPQVWTKQSEFLLSVHALLEVIVSETTNFLQECSVEVEIMATKGRESPSSSKLQYLLHLEDCRFSVHKELMHSLEVLESVTKWQTLQQSRYRMWDAGVSWQDRSASLHRDLSFLAQQLTRTTATEIKELRRVLQDRLELRNNRRSFVLTMVAAFYLPLSFATSFFGMNMTTTTPPFEGATSKLTDSWIANSPLDIQNSTRAIVSTVSNSGNLSYSWKTFAVTACCLLLTLPLSLTIESIVKLSYRSATRYATYWRWIEFLGFVAFFYFTTYGSPYHYSWQLYPYCICNGSFALYALYKASVACRKGGLGNYKGRPIFWIIMFVSIAMSSIANSLVGYILPVFPLTLFPWMFAAVGWLARWFRQQHRMRKLWLG